MLSMPSEVVLLQTPHVELSELRDAFRSAAEVDVRMASTIDELAEIVDTSARPPLVVMAIDDVAAAPSNPIETLRSRQPDVPIVVVAERGSVDRVAQGSAEDRQPREERNKH